MTIPASCECGHRKEEHTSGYKECTVPGCGCKAFHWVNMDVAKKRQCLVCRKEYSCSHKSEDKLGVCNICTKRIEDDYQGDLMNFLFGVRDSKVSKLKAKQLAMDINKHGVDIPTLWEFWCQGGLVD